MPSKRKLIISIISVVFVLLAVIATGAMVYALTQQNIKTSLKMSYSVEDIDGHVTASFTLGGVEEPLTAMRGNEVLPDNKLVFKLSN